MKKQIVITLLTIVALALFSCTGKLPEPVPGPPDISEEKVDFSHPEVGQKSRFIRYESTCDDLTGNFNFTLDTLMLEVVEVQGHISLQESLTPESPMFKAGQFPEPIVYPLTSAGDYALIPERWSSALFFFYGNDTLRLNVSHDVQLVQDACKMMLENQPFIGDEIGFIKKFEVGPIKQEDKTAVSCVPVIIDVEAYLVSDTRNLYLSHTISGNAVNGWVAL